jgi:translation initiation factor IF-2
MRVHEIAKELKVTSKSLMEKLLSLNIEVKNNLSMLSDEQVQTIKRQYRSEPPLKRESAPFSAQRGGDKNVSQDGGRDVKRQGGDQPRSDQPRSSQPRDGQPHSDQPRDNQPYSDQPRGDQPHHGDQPRSDQSRSGQPRDGQPYGGQSRNSQPRSGQSRDGQPRSDQSRNAQPRSDQPRNGQPYSGQSRNSQPRDGQSRHGQPYSGQSRGSQPLRDQSRSDQSRSDQSRSDQSRSDQPRSGQSQNAPGGANAQRPPYQRTNDSQRPRNFDRKPSDRPQSSRPYSSDRPPFSNRSGDNRPGAGRTSDGNRQQYGRPGAPASGRPGAPGSGRPGGFKPAGARPSIGKALGKPTDKPGVKSEKPQAKKPRQSLEKTVGAKIGDRPFKPKKQEKPLIKPKTKTSRKKEQRRKDKIMLEERKALMEALEKEASNDIKTVRIAQNITVKDLAEKLNTPAAEIIKQLIKVGIMATVNQEIDFYNAARIAESYDIIVEKLEEEDLLKEAFVEVDDETALAERPPVVVVMGHVDHGKTSLLDYIRKSAVTKTEAGGITQHIGAYTVPINGKKITFLDTPGHEAFTAMRLRGAKVTDIAILVVAADDGVMPQTIEAINHARAAEVDIIVAINKIDRPSANPDNVKQELTEYDLLAEEWGGDTICAPVSALTGEGVDKLLEMILLVSEMKELKANPTTRAGGAVIEALLDKGRGPVATVLVQRGTLKIGDPIIAGSSYGRVRAMIDDKGRKVKTAGPSTPVEIVGLSEVPQAGDAFYVADSEKQARHFAESIVAHGREEMIKETPKVSLNDLFSQIQAGSMKELNIVIKADVQGSVEAVKNSLERLSNDEVRIKTIHGGVGAITESDVMLASASNAIIVGFNVRPEVSAKSVADSEKVDVRLYRVIYNAIEDLTAAMKGLLDPIFEEKVIGHAEIRQLFKASGVGVIGGAYVTDGKFTKSASVRISRDGKTVFDGALEALKRFKDDVREVNAGYECGVLFHRYNDIKEGDRVEAYVMEEIPR